MTRNPVDVELLVEVVHQLHAAAEIHPGGLHAAVETERHGGAERESGVLAEIIVGRGVAHLDGAALHRVGRLQARHDLARGKDLNLEPVVARLGDRLGEGFRRAIDGIERFWIARCQPPLELRHGLRDGGLGDCGRRGGQASCPQELTTFHESSLASSAIGTARAKHVRSSSLKLETLALIADREATRPLALAKGAPAKRDAAVRSAASLYVCVTCAFGCGS